MRLVKLLMIALLLVSVTACHKKKKDRPAIDVSNNGAMMDGANGDGGLGGAGTGSDLASAPTQAYLEQAIGDRVLFDYDSHDLTAEGRTILEKQAAWMNEYPQLTVTIQGHADERGTREYNLALGDRRANAVKTYLQAYGIQADRVSTISYGKEQPAVVGSDESSWSQNRRSVTVVN
jgi:peptidoglycan-associated lipoprotein